MKHGHLTEQRKQFVEAYFRLGNGTLAARKAGYKDSPSLVKQACKLQYNKIILKKHYHSKEHISYGNFEGLSKFF